MCSHPISMVSGQRFCSFLTGHVRDKQKRDAQGYNTFSNNLSSLLPSDCVDAVHGGLRQNKVQCNVVPDTFKLC